MTTDNIRLLVLAVWENCVMQRYRGAALEFSRVQMALEEDKYCVRTLVRFHRFANTDVLFLYILPESYFP